MATKTKKQQDEPVLDYERESALAGWVQIKPGVRVRLTPEEANLYLDVRDQLRDNGTKLADGAKVEQNLDVLRWLLAQVATESPTEAE